MPLWLRLSLVSECRTWVAKGLASNAITPLPLRQRMLLHTALASVLMLTYGTGGEMREAWRQVRDDARDLGDAEHKMRALWGAVDRPLWLQPICRSLELAERYLALNSSGNQQLLGKRMRAVALFHMGDLQGARQNIDEALGSPSAPRSHIIDVHFDQRIAARCLKAKVQLLEGEVDPALRLIGACVDEAVSLDHPATLWYTLCLGAIPLALLTSNLPKMRYYLGLLQDSTTCQDLHIWRQFRRCFESILLIRQGSPEEGVPHWARRCTICKARATANSIACCALNTRWAWRGWAWSNLPWKYWKTHCKWLSAAKSVGLYRKYCGSRRN